LYAEIDVFMQATLYWGASRKLALIYFSCNEFIAWTLIPHQVVRQCLYSLIMTYLLEIHKESSSDTKLLASLCVC